MPIFGVGVTEKTTNRTMLVLGGLLLLGAAGPLVFAGGDTTGQIWASIDPNSLVGFGALVEKQIDPDLWLNVVLPVLQWPAWIVPAVLGVVLVLAARPWRAKAVTTEDAETQTA
mgnify:FL=1